VTRQNVSQHQQYRFGEFLLNPALRELRRGTEQLTSSPKVFDCIVYLIEHRARAVGRDELIAAVWGRADVTDAQLDQLMRKVRRALGGSGDGQNVIRTIPRFGFHWVAHCDIERWPDDSVAADHTRHAAPAATSKAWMWVGLSIVVIALVATGIYFWTSGREPEQDSADATTRPSAAASSAKAVFAVLPVIGDTDGESEWMRLGLMDLIAGRLRGAALIVVPSADVIALARNRTADDDLTGKVHTVLGAGDVVTPTVLRGEREWTVRLELHSAGGRRATVEAKAADAIVAAREAANRLLGLLGAVPTDVSMAALSSVDFLQRVEAARLVDNFTLARQLIESAPASLRELPQAQLQLGGIEVATGHADLARPRFARLLESVSAADDAVLRARTLIALGIAELDQAAEALPHFSEAILLLQDLDEPTYLGDACNGRGVAHSAVGRDDDARMDYARARIAYLSVNNTLALARVDNNEANLDLERGHPAEALPLLARSAQLFEQMGALDKLLSPLVNQIGAHIDLLQPADALAVFERSRSKFDRLENKANLHVWKLQGAMALIANGRLREARAIVDDVAQDTDPAREFGVQGLVAALRAELDFAAGHFDAAVASARRAEEGLSVPHRLVPERARASITLIRALQALHRDEEAKTEFRRFKAWMQNEDDRVAVLLLGVAEAEQAMRVDGRRAPALAAYEQVLLSAQRDGTPSDLAEVAVSFADALLDAGEAGRASSVVGLVGRWAAHDYSCALLQARLYRALGQHGAWKAALAQASALAGERTIPSAVAAPWEASTFGSN
jgi:DNA-binding winged helix-turn-helix (wHTH) protein/tetratricopeptide (TPR) repeat protein